MSADLAMKKWDQAVPHYFVAMFITSHDGGPKNEAGHTFSWPDPVTSRMHCIQGACRTQRQRHGDRGARRDVDEHPPVAAVVAHRQHLGWILCTELLGDLKHMFIVRRMPCLCKVPP